MKARAWLQGAAAGGRAAADLGAGRYHQFLHLRSRPAAACVRCRQAQGQCPARAWRGPARPSPRSNGKDYTLDAEMTVIADEAGASGPGRRDRRRAHRRRRGHHRRLPRSRLVRSACAPPHRPHARRRVRCALSLRARRRSRLRHSGDGTGHTHDHRTVRRRSFRAGHRRCRAGRYAPLSPSAPRAWKSSAASPSATTNAGASSRRWAASSSRTAFAFSVAPPSWRADIAAEHDLVEEVVRVYGYDAIPTATDATPAGGATGADQRAAADHLGAPGAGRPRHGRNRHLLLHRLGGGHAVRRRSSPNWCWPTRSPPTSMRCAPRCCPT